MYKPSWSVFFNPESALYKVKCVNIYSESVKTIRLFEEHQHPEIRSDVLVAKG